VTLSTLLPFSILTGLLHFFIGVILIKKAGDGSKKIKGCWDSIHVVEVQEKSSGRSAHYKLTSTSMLWLQTHKAGSGTMNLGGSLTRQVRIVMGITMHCGCPSIMIGGREKEGEREWGEREMKERGRKKEIGREREGDRKKERERDRKRERSWERMRKIERDEMRGERYSEEIYKRREKLGERKMERREREIE
jgi:hypothetical protein